MTADGRQERRLDVLRAVVRTFVATSEPVGSKAIAGLEGCAVSSATLRAVMSELEEEGYLDQPHASAGRIPTEKGYRLFVDLAMAARRKAASDPEPILTDSALGEIPEVLGNASRALARLCGCIGLVLQPRPTRTRFRHAHFLRLEAGRVMVVVVAEGGVVTDRAVELGEDYSQDELDRISNYIVNRFQGSTLFDVLRTLDRELSEEKAAYDVASRAWRRLALACLGRCAEEETLYRDGAARCVESPEFADVKRTRELLQAYEEKDRMSRLLRGCVEREGVQIQIGGEGGDGSNDVPSGLAFVASRYGDRGQPLGSLGVLGSSRMEYERVIEVVDGVASDLSRVLRGRFPARG